LGFPINQQIIESPGNHAIAPGTIHARRLTTDD
jgi:hypothetical protein